MTDVPRRQDGATLLVTLIMLIVLMLFVVSAMNSATTNLKVVGNMQVKTEAFDAAQQTLETVLSSTQFIATPSNAIVNPCNGVPNTWCPDSEYVTTLTPAPACVTVKPIKNVELHPETSTEDLSCTTSQNQGNNAIPGSTTGNSLCANSVWEINARTVGASTGAGVTVTQGIGVRISADDAGC